MRKKLLILNLSLLVGLGVAFALTYDWFIDQLGVHHPQQIEFARLNISHTL